MAGELRHAFDASVEANAEVVEGIDDAVVEAGRRIADQIDYAAENLTGQELTKALYLTPHLMNVLKELLATPAARKAAGLSGSNEAASSALGKLRLAHGKRGA